jgi:glycosyltransferase involved in cell wall biosynthesis
MINNLKFTVVIPTRERCETLGPSIRTCIEQGYDNLEIIVSDNVSEDNTEAVVRSFRDPRVRYVRTERRLSMTGNYEFALRHVDAGYFTIIGDDDGLMPEAVSTAANIIRETGTKALVSYVLEYDWPDHQIEKQRNRIFIPRVSRDVEDLKPKDEVKRLLASIHGGPGVSYSELPTPYRNFISTDVIRAASRNGRYFHSITPDVYAAFVNSFVLDRFVRIDQPLAIEGVSGRSNGASQSVGLNKSEERRYVQEADVLFHPDLVYSPSIHLIIAESFLQSRTLFPDACEDFEFNLARICGTALRDASGANRDRIVDAVKAILLKHHLDALPPWRSPRATRVWQRLQEAYNELELNSEPYGVRDVYQASLLAHHLLTMRYVGGGRTGLAQVVQRVRERTGGA